MDRTVIRVSLREAKAQLSRLADAAHCGHTIELTRYGQPWARLLPPAQARRTRPSGGRFLVQALGSDATLLLNRGVDPGLQHRLIQWVRSDVAPPSGRVYGNGMPSRGVLIDSTLLLWWWGFPLLIPDTWFRWLKSPDQPVFVSMASLQQLAEIAEAGHLPWLKEPFQCCQTLLESDGFQCLPVEVRHLQAAQRDSGQSLLESVLLAQARLDALELLSPGACLAAAATAKATTTPTATALQH